jgi:hypothetical protein
MGGGNEKRVARCFCALSSQIRIKTVLFTIAAVSSLSLGVNECRRCSLGLIESASNDNHANGHAVTARWLSPRVEVIKMEISSEVPPFCFPDRASKQQCLSDFRGKWVILYFYPKDNTAGCTREAIDFSEQQPAFF